jgi:hypothetical protein
MPNRSRGLLPVGDFRRRTERHRLAAACVVAVAVVMAVVVAAQSSGAEPAGRSVYLRGVRLFAARVGRDTRKRLGRRNRLS